MKVGDAEEEAIRKKKAEHAAKTAQVKQVEEQLKTVLRNCLDESAFERMMNVRVANKELYISAAQQMVMLYRKMGRKLTETEVLAVLRTIKSQTETETSITFQRK